MLGVDDNVLLSARICLRDAYVAGAEKTSCVIRIELTGLLNLTVTSKLEELLMRTDLKTIKPDKTCLKLDDLTS